MGTLYRRDLITTQDWTVDELKETIDLAGKLKSIGSKGGRPPELLARKNFFAIFYAPSTRTRGAFEAAMELLGGHASCIDVGTTRLEHGEALKDAVRMYDIYGDGIGVRILDNAIDFIQGQGRKVVEEFARIARVPVINMGCCTYHPTQAIGDMQTIQRKIGNPEGTRYVITWAYSSRLRGRCSIQEEILVATRFGMDVVLTHPPGFEINPEILDSARANAQESGGRFEITHKFQEALSGASVVFPRSWVSTELSRIGASEFGVDREIKLHDRHKEWRLEQRDIDDLMSKKAIVMHVLPAFRSEEVSDEVLDGPNSVIYEQAADNFYAKMAVLSLTMAEDIPL